MCQGGTCPPDRFNGTVAFWSPVRASFQRGQLGCPSMTLLRGWSWPSSQLEKSVPRQLTKLCLAFSCLKQTDQEKPVGKCNCFLNRLQGTESQVTVIESGILQLWEAYQRREGIADTGDCRTCFCRRLSRFHFGDLFVSLKQGEKK